MSYGRRGKRQIFTKNNPQLGEWTLQFGEEFNLFCR